MKPLSTPQLSLIVKPAEKVVWLLLIVKLEVTGVMYW